jgi:hypothetical protein
LKLFREPLLHFVLIGAVIYMVYGLFAEPAEDTQDNTLTVSAAEIQWMQANWQKRWNRLPTEQELDGLIQHYIKETVLYREALSMGLNKHDPVIRRRLAQKLEFLAKDLVTLTPPTEQELRAYFQEHQSRYQPPVRYSFTQIYLDPDKRGDATLDDARAMKTALAAQANAFDRAGEWGDDLMLQSHYSAVDQVEIHKQFGAEFAEAMVKLAPGQWHGPLLSGYGVHLIYVHSRQEAAPVQFTEVRERVAQDWQSAKSDELNDTFYANLRERYSIVIEKPKQDNNVTAMQEQDP